MNVGTQLKAIREERSLSQSVLGRLAGIPVFWIKQYEATTREPNVHNLRRLCVALDCSADKMLGLTGRPE
jgi:transcriptional regulator with XRE-family HTH domain